MKKLNTFWKIVFALNITEIILFLVSGFFSIIIDHSQLSSKVTSILQSISGTYYNNIGFELMIFNIFFLILSIVGMILVLKDIQFGKHVVVVTAIFFLFNRLPDFLVGDNFIYFVVLAVIVYFLFNKIFLLKLKEK